MKVSKSKVPSIPIPELRGSYKNLTYPLLAERKVDGEFNFLCYTPELCFLLNKYGTVKMDFPALNDIKEILDKTAGGSCMLVGEVYWDEGKLGQLYDLLSHKKDDNCKIALFDVVAWNGDIRREVLIDRLESLHALGLAHLTPESRVVESQKELEFYFKETTRAGYEGLVAKPLEGIFPAGPCPWSKLKYKDRSDYAVQMIDKIKERIEVMVPFQCQGGTGQGVSVGVKAPNRYKSHIKLGDYVTIEHQGVLPSGSLRHPVLIPKKEWK